MSLDSARQIQARFACGEVSAQEILEASFARIDAMDDRVGAFLTLMRDRAMTRARDLDRRRASGEDCGVLAGVPVAIKDNLCTRGARTTCASRMLADFIPPYDATVVGRLEAAGAVIVGKTNLDEFAMGSSTENSALGRTRNPWDLGRVPGGSSGGSAAAVAAGMVPIALGSDTGGSIRQPAALCGVVGLKPTYGAVSRYGLIAFASSLDQVGPLTGSVEDAARVLRVISGPDPRDSTSLPQALALPERLEGSLRSLRVGLIAELDTDGVDPETRAAVQRAADWFARSGASVERVSLPAIDHGIAVYYLIATAEASANLARYDGVRYGWRADRSDLLGMYRQTRDQGFGPEVKRRIMLGTYALSAGYYEACYQQGQLVRSRLRQDFEAGFERFDLLLSPTSPQTAFALGEKVDDPLAMYLADVATVGANLAGIPALSLPCGFDSRGLPIGLQLMGPALSEARLLGAALAFEHAHDYAGRLPAAIAGPVQP